MIAGRQALMSYGLAKAAPILLQGRDESKECSSPRGSAESCRACPKSHRMPRKMSAALLEKAAAIAWESSR